MLKRMVKGEIGSDSMELRSRVIIRVKTNSFRSVRGRSFLAVIFDEAAFWRDELSQNTDAEVTALSVPA